jgi:glycosyltransferase involved in cell wall biosynthesis
MRTAPTAEIARCADVEGERHRRPGAGQRWPRQAGAPMRVLLLNQFFHPDHAATAQLATDLAEDLVRAGLEVTVVAGRGRYLGGPVLPAREEYRGIRIRRVATTSLGKRTLVHRAADYVSFYVTAALEVARLPAFDAAIVMTTPPLIAAAAISQALRGTRIVHWQQDLYPDVAIATRALSARSPLARAMSIASRAMLSRADSVVVLGDAMVERVVAAGARRDGVEVIPSWADGDAIRPVDHCDNPFRAQLLAPERQQGAAPPPGGVNAGLAGACIIMHSGNMGRVHDVETLLEAARRLRDRRDLRFVFVGDGVKRRLVEAAARDLPNVALAPYQPRDLLPRSLSAADVHLVSLTDGLAGLSEPSKVYGIMAAGRPTVFVGPSASECACTLRRAGAGVVVRAGDTDTLAATLVDLAQDPVRRSEMGRRARAALVTSHDRRVATGRFVELLERLHGAPARPRMT